MAFCLTDLGISHNFMLSPICCFIAAVLWYGILFLEFQTSPSTFPEFWKKICSGFFPIICSLSKRHMILKPWSHECMALSLHVCVNSTDTAVVNAMCSKSALSSCLSDSLTCVFKNRLKMEWTNILIWLPLGSLTASSPPLCPFTFTCYKHELIFQYPSAIFIQTLSFYFHFYSLCSLFILFLSPCLPLRVSITELLFWPYLSVALLYTCIWTGTKASHVGMHELQICRQLCSCCDELLERLSHWLRKECTH